MPFLPALTRRNRQPEVMDQAELAEADHLDALQALERINWLSGSAGILWEPIRRLAVQRNRPIAVLDVACGAGDLAIGLWHRARRAGIDLKIAGCDLSERAVQYARLRAQTNQAEVDFFALNVLTGDLPSGYDVLATSLFLHHLEEADTVALLSRLGRAGSLVLVNDLRRSRLGWLLAWLGTRCLTRSWVARIDGPLSVQAAYTASEMLELAAQAGLAGAQVRHRWPSRLLLTWEKPTQ